MTTDGLLIGVDIGTTGVKSVLVDPGKGVIAQSTRANVLSSPHPGWAEADPAQWRENVEATISELATMTGGRIVAGIATTGMVPAVVAVDADGVPLRPAMLQNDARAVAEVTEISDALTGAGVDALAGAGVDALSGIGALAATGSVPSQQSVAPKALWLSRHEPDVWRRTRALVGSYDWILHVLGAPLHVEANWALESGAFHVTGGAYQPVTDAVPGLAERLVTVRAPGDVIGQLDPHVAARTGLTPGIPLIVGGADHVLSAYTAGLVETGDWLVKLGGAGDILAVSPHAVSDARFFLDAHVVPDLWLPNGCMATSGSLVRWVQGLLRFDELAAMDKQAATREAAAILCLPYFLGEKSPRNDPDLRGVFAGIHLGHDAVDLYRSALEGIAFGFRHNADVLRSRGIELDSATVTNGGATSLLWKQIHASVLGVPLRTIRDHPGASLGAAFAAGVGVGTFDGWHHPLGLVQDGPTIDPDSRLVERYDEAYGIWMELGDVTASTMRALSRR